MSLSWRLVISYVLVIFIALALAFITLVVVARPIQNRLSAAKLAAQSRLLARQINNEYKRGATTDQIAQQIGQRPADSAARLLFVTPAGIILADSDNAWAGQEFPVTDTANQTGRFTPPAGDTFNFSASQVEQANQVAGYVVALAARPPIVPAVFAEMSWGFALAALVALLVSLLASAVIARSVVRPLQKIGDAAAAVAAGDYAHRLPQEGPPEIRRVAISFNAMAEQVAASQQAMHDFVSNVSHELKTPLTSIQGFSQAIMEGATPDETARQKAAAIIYEEAARMARLVEDLLDLARLDSGQVVMQKTPLDLPQILNSAYTRLLPQAIEKKVALEKKWSELPAIVGDGDRLAQVFTNLLDNAVRHTPAGGRVTIGARVAPHAPLRDKPGKPERGDFVEVSISDTGPGIPPEDLARIFERFYQVDKSRKRGKGAGLGLAIIKEIIDAHSGHIRAESVTGIGAKFTVLLPITEADARTLISARK